MEELCEIVVIPFEIYSFLLINRSILYISNFDLFLVTLWLFGVSLCKIVKLNSIQEAEFPKIN